MSAIYSIVYGIHVPHYDAPEVKQWKEYGDAELELVNYDLQYSATLRNYLPIMFAPWRKAYHTYRKARIVLFTGLRERFQKRQNIMSGSYMEYLTENQKAMGIEDDDLMYALFIFVLLFCKRSYSRLQVHCSRTCRRKRMHRPIHPIPHRPLDHLPRDSGQSSRRDRPSSRC